MYRASSTGLEERIAIGNRCQLVMPICGEQPKEWTHLILRGVVLGIGVGVGEVVGKGLTIWSAPLNHITRNGYSLSVESCVKVVR